MAFLSFLRAQIGKSATAALNIVLRAPDVPDGSLIVSKGTYDAPGATLVVFNADGTISQAGGPPPTENSQKLATTAWAKFGFVFSALADGGYIKFPAWLGGFIIQWLAPLNSNNLGSGFTSSAFPLAFPNGCLGAVAVPRTSASKSYETGSTCIVSPTGATTVAWVAYLPSGAVHANANYMQAFILAVGN